ncbi:MAG: methylamine utilization protein [Pseudomonadota bacterium]
MNRLIPPIWLSALATLAFAPFACTAGNADVLTVRVLGPDQEPVPEVAISVEQVGVSRSDTAEPGLATMSQIDREFSPHMLVIETGTSVEFPNRDTVAHHVYSFSKPNDFILPLYKGDDARPVTFTANGVAILGCNIHDHMVGYIVVVDTDAFGITDEAGVVELEVSDAATEFVVNGWGPRIKRSDLPLSKRLDADSPGDVVFTLSKAPSVRASRRKGSVAWDDY